MARVVVRDDGFYEDAHPRLAASDGNANRTTIDVEAHAFLLDVFPDLNEQRRWSIERHIFTGLMVMALQYRLELDPGAPGVEVAFDEFRPHITGDIGNQVRAMQRAENRRWFKSNKQIRVEGERIVWRPDERARAALTQWRIHESFRAKYDLATDTEGWKDIPSELGSVDVETLRDHVHASISDLSKLDSHHVMIGVFATDGSNVRSIVRMVTGFVLERDSGDFMARRHLLEVVNQLESITVCVLRERYTRPAFMEEVQRWVAQGVKGLQGAFDFVQARRDAKDTFERVGIDPEHQRKMTFRVIFRTYARDSVPSLRGTVVATTAEAFAEDAPPSLKIARIYFGPRRRPEFGLDLISIRALDTKEARLRRWFAWFGEEFLRVWRASEPTSGREEEYEFPLTNDLVFGVLKALLG